MENWNELTLENLPTDRSTILFTTGGIRSVGVYLDRYINEYNDSRNVVVSINGGFYRRDLNKIYWMYYPEIPIQQNDNNKSFSSTKA